MSIATTHDDITLTTVDGLTLAGTWHRRDDATPADPTTRPVIVAVHGYPDDRRVWSELVPHLLPHADVLTYDTRGSGRSDAPATREGYGIDLLRQDVDRAVTAAADAGREVHLLAHDWGSIQAWQAVTDDGAASRIRSFTTISGPCLDHASRWMRAMARGSAHDRLLLAQQAASSTYIAFFQAPLLPELFIRSGAFGRMLQGGGGGAAREGRDMLDGLELYRANMGLRRRGRGADGTAGPRRTDVPTQIIVPTRDRYVREPMATYGAAYAATSRVCRVDAGHWAVRSHPREVAELVVEHAGL